MIAGLVARNTFREATRDRVVIGVVVAGVVIMLATQLLSPLALGEEVRLTIDLGLTGISVLGTLMIILVGTNMVAKEIERRTIYNLLSRPIARSTYIVGKWAGLSSALWIVCLALGLVLWGLLAFRGLAAYGGAIGQAVYLAGLELSVVTALAVLFSALSTPVLSALYTIGALCVGQWSYDLRAFAAHSTSATVAGTIDVIANMVPNLPLFNMRTLASAGELTSPAHLAIATIYALLYAGCALGLAAAALESRDFK